MKLKAYAKINWHLNVTGRREDGYHLLDMLMQPVSLADDLILEEADDFQLAVHNAPYVPATKDNLVLRAAAALKEFSGAARAAHIRLYKRIPVGGGLGGGSADAAAVLWGLNQMWGLHYSADVLAAIGLTLGADIPFCVYGRFARIRGIGEDVQPLDPLKPYWLVIIQPCRGLSTREVFSSLDLMGQEAKHERLEKTLLALQSTDFSLLKASMHNDLEETSLRLRPQIARAMQSLYESGAKAAMMSGSGSAVFGVFNSYKAAVTGQRALAKKYRTCCLCSTLNDGRPTV